MRLPEIFEAVRRSLGGDRHRDTPACDQAFGGAFEEQALSDHSPDDDIPFSLTLLLGQGYILSRLLDAYLQAIENDGLWPFRDDESSARQFAVHPAVEGVVKTLERLARWQTDAHRGTTQDDSTSELSWAELIEGVHEELEAIVDRSVRPGARPEDGPYADFAAIVAAQDEDRGKACD